MNYKIKLNTVDTFIFDVDGVLTNGNVLINGLDYQRSIYVKDSYAIQYASKIGYRIFLITGGESEFIKKHTCGLALPKYVWKAATSYKYLRR